jgi:hypothetical protein
MKKLMPSIVNIYAGPFGALVCWSWCVVLFLDVCFAACLLPEYGEAGGCIFAAFHSERTRNTLPTFPLNIHVPCPQTLTLLFTIMRPYLYYVSVFNDNSFGGKNIKILFELRLKSRL